VTRRSRGRLLLAAAVLGILLAAAFVLGRPKGEAALGPRAEADKPALMLLTSLPLIFPEKFGLDGGGSPAFAALQTRYHVRPIGVADADSLNQGRILLMAHARAQPAEALVDLDAWVRGGGRLLLLADPMLEWESARPLGDPLRPSPMFPDTGLLQHWGLRLDAPDKRGPAERKVAGRTVLALSPGHLSGRCEIDGEGFVARCRIGKGQVTVIADADFVDAARLGEDGQVNLQTMLSELARLER
jgi:hypothetical protein